MALVTTTLIIDQLLCNEAGKGFSSLLFQVQRGKPLTGMVLFSLDIIASALAFH
jgi:hypothetical protein